MKRETCRSIGALVGLAIGWGLMLLFPWRGLVPAFIFGIVGTLTGSMSAERWFDRRRSNAGSASTGVSITGGATHDVHEQAKHD